MRTSRLGPVGLAAGSVVLALVGTGPVLADPGPPTPAGGAGGTPASHQSAANQLGRWTVSRAGAGSYRLTWHSPTRIPTTDAPVQVRHHGSVATASVSANSRTVSVVVPSATRPDPSAYDVVLGARVLDRRTVPTAPPTGTDRSPYRAPTTRELAGDPGDPGSHAIVSTDYRLDPVKLPGIAELSEMVGHIVAPVDATDASPLVLFLHGRHERLLHPRAPTPTGRPPRGGPAGLVVPDEGRSRSRATSATTTCSVCSPARATSRCRSRPTPSTRSTSATPDGGAAARAALIRDHLRAWVGFVGGRRPTRPTCRTSCWSATAAAARASTAPRSTCRVDEGVPRSPARC